MRNAMMGIRWRKMAVPTSVKRNMHAMCLYSVEMVSSIPMGGTISPVPRMMKSANSSIPKMCALADRRVEMLAQQQKIAAAFSSIPPNAMTSQIAERRNILLPVARCTRTDVPSETPSISLILSVSANFLVQETAQSRGVSNVMMESQEKTMGVTMASSNTAAM